MQLATYRHFADRDALSRVVLEQMLAGVSTRRFERMRERVGVQVEAEARCVSKSAVSREFVTRTRENLEALMSRRLDDVRLAVLMVDGIELKGRTNVVALGFPAHAEGLSLGTRNRRRPACDLRGRHSASVRQQSCPAPNRSVAAALAEGREDITVTAARAGDRAVRL